jgi:hypothetical protein
MVETCSTLGTVIIGILYRNHYGVTFSIDDRGWNIIIKMIIQVYLSSSFATYYIKSWYVMHVATNSSSIALIS